MKTLPTILVQDLTQGKKGTSAFDCETLLIFQGKDKGPETTKSTQAHTHHLNQFKKGDAFAAKSGSLQFVRFGGQGGCENALFVGLGNPEELTEEKLRSVGGLVWQKWNQEKTYTNVIYCDAFKEGRNLKTGIAPSRWVGFLLVFFRLSLRNFLRTLRKKGYNLRFVLAVGEGDGLKTLIHRLEKFPELGLRVVGVAVHETMRKTMETLQGKPVVGTFAEVGELVHRFKADQVLIALTRAHSKDLDRILATLKDETVSIQLVPDIHEYITLGCEVEDFDGLPIVKINDSPLNGWGAILKRVTDIVLSTLALVILSPLLALITLLIKITSPGPVLFRQTRMGLDGRTFEMLKFRSMHLNAEAETGAVWAKPNDDRRTRFGSFIRATSLDELPQLWNVFVGDMSLVGPRPERPVFVQQFRDEIPHYMLRHKVKAGMTGWAQVLGWRGNTSLDRRIECDLFYIRNWSYTLDLKILLLTVWKGFVNKNAY